MIRSHFRCDIETKIRCAWVLARDAVAALEPPKENLDVDDPDEEIS